MLKKIMKGLLCLYVFGAASISNKNIHAYEVAPMVLVYDLPMSQSQNIPVSFVDNRENITKYVNLTLIYTKHINGSQVTYDDFTTLLKEASYGSYDIKQSGIPQINISLNLVEVSGYVNIYSNANLGKLLARKPYSVTFTLK